MPDDKRYEYCKNIWTSIMRWALIGLLLLLVSCRSDSDGQSLDDAGQGGATPASIDVRASATMTSRSVPIGTEATHDATRTGTPDAAERESTTVSTIGLTGQSTSVPSSQSVSTPTRTPTAGSTPEPTSTPEPQPTATATPEPTATATPEPEKPLVEVVQWTLTQSTFDDRVIYVIGELTNSGTGDAEQVDIVVSAVDPAGVVIASTDAVAILPLVRAGAKSPFKATFQEITPDQIGDVQFDVRYQPSSDVSDVVMTYALDLSVTSVEWAVDHLAGEVQNNGDEAVEVVIVIVVGYDAVGTLVGIETVLAETERLEPGLTATFFADLYEYVEPPTLVEAHAYAFVVR